MPSAHTVLSGLTEIANDWRWVAISWHVLLAASFAMLIAGWRPSIRLLGWLVVGPLLTVSLVAWLSGNPFNGAVFAILAATPVFRAKTAVRVVSSPWAVPGAVLVMFGWIYPHFVSTDSWMAYLYTSPFGILPCPTLSTAIGLTLLFPDLRTRSATVPLVGAGLLYGAVGVFRLGVALDWGLLVASVALAAATGSDVVGWRSSRAKRVERSRPLPAHGFIRDSVGTLTRLRGEATRADRRM